MTDLARALREPWPDLRLQREGVGLGMWMFLASEVLFFAGLFVSYAIYRSFNAEAFRVAAAHTSIVYGSFNTAILLTSSLTMTVALRAATLRLRELTVRWLVATALLGLAFLLCKGLEYRSDLAGRLVPGPGFPLSPLATQLFWELYWIMTGIHAIHLSAGIGVVLVVTTMFQRRIVPVQGSTTEGVAIYWHFVDSVWIILYPLLSWRGAGHAPIGLHRGRRLVHRVHIARQSRCSDQIISGAAAAMAWEGYCRDMQTGHILIEEATGR